MTTPTMTSTCSNCGAAVRPGAKFCTACGTRLNDVAANAAAPEWTASHPVAEPPETDATPGNPDTNLTTTQLEQEADQAPPAAADPQPWSWRSSPADTDTPEGGDIGAGTASEVPRSDEGGDVSDDLTDERRVFHVDWSDTTGSAPESGTATPDDFTWTWSAADPSEAASGDGDDERDEAVPEASPPVTDTPVAATAASSADADDSHLQDQDHDTENEPTSGFWSTDSTPETSEVAAPDDFSMTAADTVDREPAAVVQAVDETGPQATTEDPLDRARHLVEELLTLIPASTDAGQVPPDATSEAAARLAEVRDGLEAARGSSDFADLRTALESARARPRDVDTMLDLVERIDRMMDVLDDRDRLAAAVDQAIGLLEPAEPASGQDAWLVTPDESPRSGHAAP